MYILISVVLAIALTVSVSAAEQVLQLEDFAKTSLTIYNGAMASLLKAGVGNWGSGRAQETTAVLYHGNKTVEITSNDMYNGGRIDFGVPVDATEAFNENDAYFQVAVKTGAGGSVASKSTGRSPTRQKPERKAPSGVPGMSMPGMDLPGMGGPGMLMPGSTMGTSQAQSQRTSRSTSTSTASKGSQRPVRKLRIMITFEGERSLDATVDLYKYGKSKDGWTYIAIPVSELKSRLNLPSYKITRIAICSDGTQPFHIGEVTTSSDPGEIKAYLGGNKNVARNTPVTFSGSASARLTALKYSWDFNEADGIQVEAVGSAVNHTFREAGDYIVTLTVSDQYGIKKPSQAKMRVKVNP